MWQSICPECYKTVAESREEANLTLRRRPRLPVPKYTDSSYRLSLTFLNSLAPFWRAIVVCLDFAFASARGKDYSKTHDWINDIDRPCKCRERGTRSLALTVFINLSVRRTAIAFGGRPVFPDRSTR
jgi:hypothetical protein